MNCAPHGHSSCRSFSFSRNTISSFIHIDLDELDDVEDQIPPETLDELARKLDCKNISPTHIAIVYHARELLMEVRNIDFRLQFLLNQRTLLQKQIAEVKELASKP